MAFPDAPHHRERAMNAAVRTKIIWGVIALVAGILMLKSCHDSQVAENEQKEQKTFRKEQVAPLLKKVNDATAPRSAAGGSRFDASEFLAKLESYDKRTASQRGEIERMYSHLQEKQGTELPEHECKQWERQLARLREGMAALNTQQGEAQDVYNTQMQRWQEAAAETEAPTVHTAELDALTKDLETLQATAESKRRNVDNGGVAYTAYTIDIKRIKKRVKLLQQKREEWERTMRAAAEARAAVVTADGAINRAGEPIRRADALMDRIMQGVNCAPDALAAPTVLPAPPPPPFVPDIRMVATGDLADSLLEPLVNQWLKARHATPAEGSDFTWNMPDEQTREIEVKVPEALQGADKGVLRIRLVSEPNGAAAFTGLLPGGNADLVLTGRKMNKQTEASWLPQGKTLEMLDPKGKGRAYRTRVCSDALIFFRGDGMTLDTVTSGVLAQVPKLFDMDNAGRVEAAAIFNLFAGAADKRALLGDTPLSAINRDNPGHLFLGTWHKDGLNHSPGRALSASGNTALGYSTCWDDEKVLKNIPAEYRASAGGCLPTDETINSGQYAFSYNITFYRSTHAEPKAAAAADLMAYASDVNNKDVEELVRLHGFAPLQFELNKPGNTLTDKDLPLALAIRRMEGAGLDMGYDADTSTWVYGVRIPIPLYYEVGSVTSDGKKAVEIDPDSRYYSESQGLQAINKLVQDRRACLVLVGHADPQWARKLDTGRNSWENNLKLSNERAKGVYSTLFQDVFSGNANLGNVQLGTSWARPAGDLDLNKPIEEQEAALSRCRRVDIFLIFPLTVDE